MLVLSFKETLESPEHFRPRSDVIFEIPFDLGDPIVARRSEFLLPRTNIVGFSDAERVVRQKRDATNTAFANDIARRSNGSFTVVHSSDKRHAHRNLWKNRLIGRKQPHVREEPAQPKRPRIRDEPRHRRL